MKIKLTKKRNSVSVRFSAQGDKEGVDLAEIVMAAGKKPARSSHFGESSGDFMATAIKELERRGYKGGVTKESRNSREFTVRNRNDPTADSPGQTTHSIQQKEV